jgi:hypothetical protein
MLAGRLFAAATLFATQSSSIGIMKQTCSIGVALTEYALSPAAGCSLLGQTCCLLLRSFSFAWSDELSEAVGSAQA